MADKVDAEIRRLHSVLRERGNEIIRLKALIEAEAVHFETRWGKHMGMSGDYVAKRLRLALGQPESGSDSARLRHAEERETYGVHED